MDKFRLYGNPPFKTVLVHGGPGAPGSLQALASELSKKISVVEALQSKNSIKGQVEELRETILKSCRGTCILIGHSWGAWLSCILAAKYPELIQKLILVSTPALETIYFNTLIQNRLNRIQNLQDPELKEAWKHIKPTGRITDQEFCQLGKLITKTDSFHPIEEFECIIEYQSEVFHAIWKEADELRNTGKLLEYVKNLKCPVIAIHGDHDSHPWQGVKNPLEDTLADFTFFLLEKCGHEPWNELYAKDEFVKILTNSIS